MKIPKSYIGKEVRLTWRDPITSERMDLSKAPKGLAALATWRERGVIDDITEGVVRFVQSEAYSPGKNEPDEAIIGWVVEDLITDCQIMEVSNGNSHS